MRESFDTESALQNPRDEFRAYQILVDAQGADAGKILRKISIAHTAFPQISIYDASITAVVPNPIYRGVEVLKDGKPTFASKFVNLTVPRAAQSNFERVMGFYADQLGRFGFDGDLDGVGARVHASVNTQRLMPVDLLGMRQNAAWMAPWKMFVFGAGGDEIGALAEAIDVVGHEFTHAVISHSSDLEYVGQSGALNEHLADVFGAMIQEHFDKGSNPYLIGESVLRGELAQQAEALRDMWDPHKSLSKQPAHVSETPAEFGAGCAPSESNDNCGVHILSGIPNRAFALVASQLGWAEAYELFYRVMTERLRTNSDFKDYRDQVLDECERTLSTKACGAIRGSFAQVGL